MKLQERYDIISSQLSSSFDVVSRHLSIQGTQAWVFFISSLSDSALITRLVESFVSTVSNHLNITFYPGGVEAIQDDKKAITNLLSGQALVLLEHSDDYYCIET